MTRSPGSILPVLLAGLLAATACGGIDGAIVNLGMRDKSTYLPDAAPSVVVGWLQDAPAGTVIEVYSAAGEKLKGISGASDDTGRFEIRFPGNTAYDGLRLDARWSDGQALGIVPGVRTRCKVTDPEKVYDLETMMPGAGTLSTRSTAISLAIQAKALADKRSIASYSRPLLKKMSDALNRLVDQGDADVAAFVTMVAALLKDAPRDGAYPFVAELPAGAAPRDLVDKASLAAAGLSADGFETAALAAVAKVDAKVCYPSDRIRVVFEASFSADDKDLNCKAIDPFKWAKEAADKSVFFTGGVHDTTPICGESASKPFCIDKETLTTTTLALGNWVPNQVQMYDDGTHGDAVTGDHVWTVAFDVPLIPLADNPSGTGLRIGYKYTYGKPGDNWTGTEEWPGNQRILEVVDVNGDHMVIRRDSFADETSNKDKMNLLSPAKGGCGTNHWENDVVKACGHDTRERPFDTNGDCMPDEWPAAGAVSPITEPCPGETGDAAPDACEV